MFPENPADQGFDFDDGILDDEIFTCIFVDDTTPVNQTPSVDAQFNPLPNQTYNPIQIVEPETPSDSELTFPVQTRQKSSSGRLRKSKHQNTVLTQYGSQFYDELSKICRASGCKSPIKEFLLLLHTELNNNGCQLPPLNRDEKRIKNMFLNKMAAYSDCILQAIRSGVINLKEIEERADQIAKRAIKRSE